MPPKPALAPARRLTPTLRRFLPRRARRKLWMRPEFERVNGTAGIEPVRPETSGLRLREPPHLPPRVGRVLPSLLYRWQPSEEHRRRASEAREMNRALRSRRPWPALPPILTYPQDTEVSPTRLRPYLDATTDSGGARSVEDVVRDLDDLAVQEERRAPWAIDSLLLPPRGNELMRSRPLLPRRYREFLRASPYPRWVAGALSMTMVVGGTLWMMGLRHDEVAAASRFHVARSAFQRELESAVAYGVDPRALRPLSHQAAELRAEATPRGIVIDRRRVRFYRAEERRYAAMLRELRALEHRALGYWTWREGLAYAPLMAATREANAAGLGTSLPPIPACSTPACFRRAVAWQEARTHWLRETAGTLRIYAASIRNAPDPAAAASTETTETETLRSLLPATGRVTLPASTAELDRGIAGAASPWAAAKIGALAHLDRDVLHLALVRSLPRRAAVVSLEQGSIALYQAGRVVLHGQIAAGTGVPTGLFHVQAMQASVPALLWNGAGRNRQGALLDWMALGPDVALEGAPWRTSFGPGAPQPTFSPDTPGAIDLPPALSNRLFRWASIGTEVVIY